MMPEAGHITPTLRVAAFLRKGGHQVSYVTVSLFSALFDRLGFEHVVMPTTTGDLETQDVWATRQSGDVIGRDIGKYIRATGSSWKELVLGHVHDTRPDLVICDMTIAHLFEGRLPGWLTQPVVAMGTSLPEREAGPVQEIVLCPIEFDLPAECGHPASRQYCEPSIWHDRVRIDFPWHLLNAQQKLVYCSLGTQSVNYAEAVAVLRAVIATFDGWESHQVLVAAGPLYDAIMMTETLPDNALIVRSAPQLEILEHADLIITHGGLGTLKEAIMARVPALVIPFLFDQPTNGRRVEFHGIGRACLPSDCSPDALRPIVAELTDNEPLQTRLDRLSAIFWARESECRAGQLLTQTCARFADHHCL
jgi:UDP:flavonoid glycosyltransferase YjiC (YdhE family)